MRIEAPYLLPGLRDGRRWHRLRLGLSDLQDLRQLGDGQLREQMRHGSEQRLLDAVLCRRSVTDHGTKRKCSGPSLPFLESGVLWTRT